MNAIGDWFLDWWDEVATIDRFGAIIAWIGSYLTTALCCVAVAVALKEPAARGWAVALVIEILFTIGKRKNDVVGVGFTAVDTVVNAGGLWAIVLRMDATPVWKMLSEAFTLEKSIRLLPALAVTLGLGYLLSIAPKILWNRK